MVESNNRYMRPDDYIPLKIPRGRYCNENDLIAYIPKAYVGKPLHPAGLSDIFEVELRQTFANWKKHAELLAFRTHIKMPHWDHRDVPNNYLFVDTPDNLTTTSVTVVTVPNEPGRKPFMGFYFNRSTLPALRERIEQERKNGIHFQGLAGNLGYYITENLIKGNFRWAHNNRFAEEKFHLPIIFSYIGFYLFRKQGKIYSTFQGAHPAAVGIRRDGIVEIIPKLDIEEYNVKLWGQSITIGLINPSSDDYLNASEEQKRVILFTPAVQTLAGENELRAAIERSKGRDEGWQKYSPMIPFKNRVNVFIANEGDGQIPIEKVVQVWIGESPLPSFGAILSFERNFFEKLYVNVEIFGCLEQSIQIEPRKGRDIKGNNFDFDKYEQIMGGFVPAVIDEINLYYVNTFGEIMEELGKHGATSPITQCGRETMNFDPYVREPAGLLVQTENRIGWVLFDGRHELSIGVNVVDVARILKMMDQDEGIRKKTFDGEKIKQAVFIDGGSAMKAYAIKNDDITVTLDLLNRVAAGSRNGPGADADGLNLYTMLKLSF